MVKSLSSNLLDLVLSITPYWTSSTFGVAVEFEAMFYSKLNAYTEKEQACWTNAATTIFFDIPFPNLE